MRSRAAMPIVLATLLCYSPLFLSSAVEFLAADRRLVVENPAVHDLGNAGRFFSDPLTGAAGDWAGSYRPLRTLDYALDWAVAGASPRWFHLRGLLYHAIGALILLRLLRGWGAGEAAAAAGALVFALHPVQVEAAGRIAGRGDALCLVLFLGALLAHQRSRGFDLRFLASLALLAAALLSRETAIVFPAAAILADFFFFDGRRPARTLGRWPKYLAQVAVAGAFVALFLSLHGARGVSWWLRPDRWGGSLGGALLTMARGLVYYARLVVLPFDFVPGWYLRPVSTADPLTLLCAASVVTLVGFAAVRTLRSGGGFAFAVMWAFVLLIPALNLFAPTDAPTAERFLYLPMAGVALPVGALLARAAGRGRVGQAAAGAMVACLGLVTVSRASDQVSDGSLARSASARFDAPDALAWRAEELRQEGAQLGVQAQELRRRGERRAAIDLGERSVEALGDAGRLLDRAIGVWRRISPSGPEISDLEAKRARLHLEEGNVDLALSEADEILGRCSGRARGRALLVRAGALSLIGDPRAAARTADVAVDCDGSAACRKDAAGYHQRLARWYGEGGFMGTARTLQALRRSWELWPDPEGNREVREAISQMEAEFKDAAAPLRREIQAHPEAGDLRVNLAVLLARFGDYAAAGPMFEHLLSPWQLGRDPRILFPFARFYWETRDTREGYGEAEKIYREIQRLEPGFPGIRDALDGVKRARALLEQSLAR